MKYCVFNTRSKKLSVNTVLNGDHQGNDIHKSFDALVESVKMAVYFS